MQSVQGRMLCCAGNDAACLSKQREAHPAGDHDSGKKEAPGVDAPWFSGISSGFARLPLWNGGDFDICIVGAPYDLGGSSARLAPGAARVASRRLKPWHRGFQQSLQELGLSVVDADDLPISPFDVRAAARDVEMGLGQVLANGRGCVVLGGDHGITYGMLKAAHARYGTFALVHFDAQLDAHGTPLRWSVAQGLFDVRHSIHVGVRGTVASKLEDVQSGELGFETLTAVDALEIGVQGVVARILKRLHRRDGTYMPAFILLDMDVLDPAFAPGVVDPEVGGFSTAQLQAILVGMQGSTQTLSAAVLGAAPESDPTKTTGMVMANLANDLLHLIAKGGSGLQPPPLPPPRKTGKTR